MSTIKVDSKQRILVALLIIGMLLTMMPLQAFADDNTVCYVGTFKDSSAVFDVHETAVTVLIDQNTMKATVTFDRTKCEIKSYYLNNSDYNKLVQNAKEVKGVKSGEITCTAKKEAAGSPYMFRLYDFVWESNPYPVSVGKYPASNMTLSTNYNYGKIYTLEKDELNMTEAELEKDHPYGYDYINLSFSETKPAAAPAEEPAEKKYVFGKDSYSFLNTASSFVNTVTNDTAGPGLAYNSANGYYLSPDYYDTLCSGATNSQIASMNSMIWKGHCRNIR